MGFRLVVTLIILVSLVTTALGDYQNTEIERGRVIESINPRTNTDQDGVRV